MSAVNMRRNDKEKDETDKKEFMDQLSKLLVPQPIGQPLEKVIETQPSPKATFQLQFVELDHETEKKTKPLETLVPSSSGASSSASISARTSSVKMSAKAKVKAGASSPVGSSTVVSYPYPRAKSETSQPSQPHSKDSIGPSDLISRSHSPTPTSPRSPDLSMASPMLMKKSASSCSLVDIGPRPLPMPSLSIPPSLKHSDSSPSLYSPKKNIPSLPLTSLSVSPAPSPPVSPQHVSRPLPQPVSPNARPPARAPPQPPSPRSAAVDEGDSSLEKANIGAFLRSKSEDTSSLAATVKSKAAELALDQKKLQGLQSEPRSPSVTNNTNLNATSSASASAPAPASVSTSVTPLGGQSSHFSASTKKLKKIDTTKYTSLQLSKEQVESTSPSSRSNASMMIPSSPSTTLPVSNSPKVPAPQLLSQLTVNNRAMSSSSLKKEVEEESKSQVKSRFNSEKLQQPDSQVIVEQDLIVVKNMKTGEKTIKGGTLDKLIEELTSESLSDLNHLAAFLLTYRSFTDSSTLLDKLIERYLATFSETWLDNEKTAKIIRFRTESVATKWFGKYHLDFANNPEEVNQLVEAIESRLLQVDIAPDFKDLGGSMLKLLKSEHMKKDYKPVHMFSEDPPVSIEPKSAHFRDFHNTEVARQMTLIEYDMYRSIQPNECLEQRWNKMKIRAPHIVTMIKHFNKVNNWVQWSILSCDKPKDRASTIERFIRIAWKCKKLNNLNAVMEIVSALQSAAIGRLKSTWKLVEKSKKEHDRYQLLLELTSESQNKLALRKVLKSITPPCVPYLGMFLTDLTFIEDGNPNFIQEGDKCLINFDKCMKISLVIRDIQQMQQTPYNLRPVELIQDSFSNLPESISEDAMFDASLRLEPKRPGG